MKSKTGVTATNPDGDSKTSSTGGVDILLTSFAGSGSTSGFGVGSYLWSSSAFDGTVAWCRYIATFTEEMSKDNIYRHNLFSVRCKKD